MAQSDSSDLDFHLVRIDLEIDGMTYSVATITEDTSVWFATSVGQGVTLAILEHFSDTQTPEQEDD